MSILEIVLVSYILISWLLVITTIAFVNNNTIIGIVMMVVCPPLILFFVGQAIHYHIKEKTSKETRK